jgi:hypothetical protein
LLEPHQPEHIRIRDDQVWVQPKWGHTKKQQINKSTNPQISESAKQAALRP